MIRVEWRLCHRLVALLTENLTRTSLNVHVLLLTPALESPLGSLEPRVTVNFSQRDLAQDTFRKWTSTYTFTNGTYHPAGFPIDNSGLVACVPSPSGRLLACLRVRDKKGGTPNAKSWWIEILTRRHILCSVNTDAVHGRIMMGVPFGSLVWSPEEDAIAYTADPLPRTHKSLFEDIAPGPRATSSASSNSDKTGSSAGGSSQSSCTQETNVEITTADLQSASSPISSGPAPSTVSQNAPKAGSQPTNQLKNAAADDADKPEWFGTGNDYVEDWGEQLNGVTSPTLYVFHIPSRSVLPVPGVPDPSLLSIGQPQWVKPANEPNSTLRGLVFVGFPVTPRRFGLIFYNSRPSHIYYVPLPEDLTSLIPPSKDDEKVDTASKSKPTHSPYNKAKTPDLTKITAVCLTPEEIGAQVPRFSPDFKYLSYLSTDLRSDAPPVHCTTSTLRVMQWPGDLADLEPISTLQGAASVDSQQLPAYPKLVGCWKLEAYQRAPKKLPSVRTAVGVPRGSLSDGEFPGLYVGADPDLRRWWLSGHRIVLNTLWRSTEELLIADVSKLFSDDSPAPTSAAPLAPGTNAIFCPLFRFPLASSDLTGLSATAKSLLAPVSGDRTRPSIHLFDVAGDSVLISVSNLNTPPVLFSVKVGPTQSQPGAVTELNASKLIWHEVIQSILDDFQTDIKLGGVDEGEFWSSPSFASELAARKDPKVYVAPTSPAELARAQQQVESYVVQVPHEVGSAHHFEALVTFNPHAQQFNFASSVSSAENDTSSTLPRFFGAKGVILFPHGGPHGAFSTLYDFATATLSLLGFAIVRVNYRGSIGFGQAALELLPGNCGTMDVTDCMSSLEFAQRKIAERVKEANPSNADLDISDVLSKVKSLPVFVFGGSHGGFLVTHLTGQYPDAFSACVARNPVTNLVYNVFTSDIPDWSWVESGQPFDPDYEINPENIVQFFNVSPVRYMNRVKTPTLLMVGVSDRRVPMGQSFDYYRALQARRVASRLIVYEGAQHGLNDKPVIHADSLVNSILWFLEHGGLSKT